jgi:hypothetical protein
VMSRELVTISSRPAQSDGLPELSTARLFMAVSTSAVR